MNYPTPENLPTSQGILKDAPEYIWVPEYRNELVITRLTDGLVKHLLEDDHRHILGNSGGFTPLNGDGYYDEFADFNSDGDDEFTDGPVTRSFSDGNSNNIPAIFSRIDLVLSNNTHQVRTFKLFNSVTNMTLQNFGNTLGQTIETGNDRISYHQILENTENSPSRVSRIVVEIVQKPDFLSHKDIFDHLNCILKNRLQHTTTEQRLDFLLENWQMATHICTVDIVPRGFDLNGFSEINLDLTPDTVINITFYKASDEERQQRHQALIRARTARKASKAEMKLARQMAKLAARNARRERFSGVDGFSDGPVGGSSYIGADQGSGDYDENDEPDGDLEYGYE